MIKKWILNNFKSIDDVKELKFRPLTIFTGANSSGKSTILQSILLVTQTIQDQIDARSIVLNGWFKKFGSYSDIVFHREYARNVKIGFEITDDTHVDDFLIAFYNDDIENVTCEFVISSDGKADCLTPVLESLSLKAAFGQGRKHREINLSRNPQRNAVENTVIDQCKGKYRDVDFSYNLNKLTKDRFSLYHSKIDYSPLGCHLSHFLPNSVLSYTTKREFYKKWIQEFLLMDSNVGLNIDEDDQRTLESILKDKVHEIVEEIYNSKLFRDEKTFLKLYNKISPEFTFANLQRLFRKTTLDSEQKRNYVKELIKLIDTMPEEYMIQHRPMYYYHPGPNFVRNFFSRRIKYLGPLREEPKSLYALETSNTPMELGLKGENTAAVYNNNKDRIINFYEPSHLQNGICDLPPISRGPLSEAVAKWLLYLGVANQIKTDDLGKIGHELKITNELIDMPQDLTHVGVGVSQVLPILVMSFLASKGDVIILEQPELHLHPRVQTRLADFFVSMTQLGKQCIIETHSEYFINRLRYRVAVSNDSNISDNTMIYFVEKDKIEGDSNYREITINKYGVIEDWPEGFFDESEMIAAEILKAGIKKKMTEINY